MRFTIRDLIWLTALVAVALAVFFVRPHRVRWEYKTVTSFNPTENLNAEGEEGRELVGFQAGTTKNTVFHFKRPKSN